MNPDNDHEGKSEESLPTTFAFSTSRPLRMPLVESSEEPERGGCLTLWLVVSAIFGVVTLFGFFNLFGTVSRMPPSMRPISFGAFCLVGGVVVAQLVCLWGIWEWKKWGVYGAVVLIIANPFVRSLLMSNFRATDAVVLAVQLGILYFLVNEKWKYFK